MAENPLLAQQIFEFLHQINTILELNIAHFVVANGRSRKSLQLPNFCSFPSSADVTEILSYGYWPSYNVPYFPYIYNISGFPHYAELYGPFFSYQDNPRGEIFRRNADSVCYPSVVVLFMLGLMVLCK